MNLNGLEERPCPRSKRGERHPDHEWVVGGEWNSMRGDDPGVYCSGQALTCVAEDATVGFMSTIEVHPVYSQLVRDLQEAGFQPEPFAYPADTHYLTDGLWLYRGEWREGTLGRPGWPINATRIIIPSDPDEEIAAHSFDAHGVNTGSVRLSGQFRFLAHSIFI